MQADDLKAAFQTFVDYPEIDEALVLVKMKNGSSFSVDNGLTVEEAGKLMEYFRDWLEKCLVM